MTCNTIVTEASAESTGSFGAGMAFRVIPFAKTLDSLINKSLHVTVPKV